MFCFVFFYFVNVRYTFSQMSLKSLALADIKGWKEMLRLRQMLTNQLSVPRWSQVGAALFHTFIASLLLSPFQFFSDYKLSIGKINQRRLS